MQLLTEKDLGSILALIEHHASKVQSKLKLEKNPKIVNFKIRSFIEKIRDVLDKHDGDLLRSSPVKGDL
jgi:hypothetical protein